MSNSGCPACTSSLFLTCTASTLPATSAATGTTKACTRACVVCGVSRSAAKYQSRLAAISASTTVAPIRSPCPAAALRSPVAVDGFWLGDSSVIVLPSPV
jgi:uncharacterized protein YciW